MRVFGMIEIFFHHCAVAIPVLVEQEKVEVAMTLSRSTRSLFHCRNPCHYCYAQFVQMFMMRYRYYLSPSRASSKREPGSVHQNVLIAPRTLFHIREQWRWYIHLITYM
jgi:hypothetical protein